MAYTIQSHINKPFDWLDGEDTWAMLVDYSNDHEYTYLDDMYRAIDGTITVREFNRMYDCSMTKKQIKKAYKERFPQMLAEAMIAMANDIKEGKLIIDIDTENFN